LTLTANNATRYYGATNQTFTGTVSGAQYSDTFVESFTTTATGTSAPNTYAIVPSVAGANLADYNVTATDGTLTVTQAPTETTVVASASTTTPGQSVTFTATVASTTTGTPTQTVSFFDNGTLLNAVSLTGGVASYSAVLSPGTTHTITVAYSGDADFLASTGTSSAVVTVSTLNFTLSPVAPAAYTVVPGQAATYTFSIAPNFSSYAGAVSFSVTGLPPGATATFSPTTISATAGPQIVTLTVQTQAVIASNNGEPLSRPSRDRQLPLLAFLLLPGMLGLGSRRLREQIGKRMLLLVLCTASLISVAGLAGCGSNAGFLTERSSAYTLTITATAGTVQHSQTVTLAVQ